MASKELFRSSNKSAPPADAVNNAGGRAYKFEAKHELAQLAVTGMLAGTYYVSADDQLSRVLELTNGVEPEFIAKVAVYSRDQASMKDMPALLAAVLFARGENVLLKQVFSRVITNGRMLRNFVQIVRSGKTGRTSFGTAGKRLIQNWLEARTDDQLFRDSVGNDPSLADVIKMVHPRPTNPTRQALYRYLIGKELSSEQRAVLPALVDHFELFKSARNGTAMVASAYDVPPDVPFQMLTALNLTTEDWTQIALNGNWQFLRMNLNTFARHGVFADKKVVKAIADKLRDPEAVAKSKTFPYQLLVAYLNVGNAVPQEIKLALQDALEHATKNVPAFYAPNGVLVFVDVSGSMGSPVSGDRGSATTAARCIDVAALIASSVLRVNTDAEVVAFDTCVHAAKLNPRDSVMTNADKLRKFGGGGTNCSLPLAAANATNTRADLIIYVSDNESWVDAGRRGTLTMHEWKQFKAHNPEAKMVNINLTPAATTQASNSPDIINIGGFSDTIFQTIANFVAGTDKNQWVQVIESTPI